MTGENEVGFSLKVLLSKQKNKVLFAEVDSDFADVLFSFLALPMGTIVRLLGKHYGNEGPILGSFKSLYEGIANLSSSHFWEEAGKMMLLKPRSSCEDQFHKLKLNIDDTSLENYICELAKTNSLMGHSVSMYPGSKLKCSCGTSLKLVTGKSYQISPAQTGSSDGVFTTKTASFIVTDDLQIFPNLTESWMQILNHYGIRDIDGLEERTVIFGLTEIMDLLKGSLFSKSPLTDIILNKRQVITASLNSEPVALLPQRGEYAASSNSVKMTVKVILERSTKRVLFAQSREEFPDFLFSFLTIPLGSVLHLLGSDSSLTSIDNLYSSIKNLNYGTYLKTLDNDNTLLQPQLPPKFLSECQIFSLTEQRFPDNSIFDCVAAGVTVRYRGRNLVDPKGNRSYVKGPTTFMVTDDLVVTPFSSISSLFHLNQMKIPISDVEERVLDIGLVEALSILKTSLTSTSALTNALKPFLMAQPKQENI